ncbi:LytR/AlgR family response regulator transcription factor [Flagellimonas sp.]|uniref:LytR/AlgR family response regulator transcription factor n=1 Tax=Flagellimonas sp. TaxID=2058762 RepID=UPI003F4A4484
MKLDLVIVDDSNLWLSLTKKLAENHPLVGRIETFNDSIDAWVYLQLTRPDLVMTDIEMPGMNGLSFLEMFGDKLPIISSSTKQGYALHAKELGCIDFLQKPFTKKVFNRAITEAHQKCYKRRRFRKRQKFSTDIW